MKPDRGAGTEQVVSSATPTPWRNVPRRGVLVQCAEQQQVAESDDRIGLGHTDDATRLVALANAVGHWCAQPTSTDSNPHTCANAMPRAVAASRMRRSNVANRRLCPRTLR